VHYGLDPDPEVHWGYPRHAAESGRMIIPLYRKPQPTLTDEERTFLRMVRDTYAMQDDDEVCGMIAASISGLLERTK
jgi:hypothetical protein